MGELSAHGVLPRDWGHWRTIEGGFVVDRQGLYEAFLVATGEVTPDDPALPRLAAERRAALSTDPTLGRQELHRVLRTVLDHGRDCCPHGEPLWMDLAVPETFRPTERLTIAPPSHPAGEGAWLTLLAGPVLGSGGSPWTRMILGLLERYVRPGARVADVGTGTGVLGLYAALLGAAQVDAVDRFDLAVALARWNVRVNGLADRVRIVAGSAERLDGAYDLAILSLNYVDDVPPVLRVVTPRIAPGGVVILSPAQGESEAVRFDAALRDSCYLALERLERDGWWVVAGRRPN